MKKKTIKRCALLALAISVLLLVSCVLSACSFLLSCEPYVSDDELADQKMEQIVTAINNRDKEALQSLFSKQAENDALEDGISISSKIDSFFELFQDEIIEWKVVAKNVSEELSYGRTDMKRMTIICSVYTNEQEYIFYVEDYKINLANPDRLGLYFLWVVHEEEDAYQTVIFDQMEPGVYYKPGYYDNVRRIEGLNLRYTHYDRHLTAESIRTIVEKNDDYNNVVTNIGKPNSLVEVRGNYYFELENGLFAVCKLRNILRSTSDPNPIIAVYIADDEKNIETIWTPDDVVKLMGEYRYYSSIKRELTEEYFVSFAERSNDYSKLIKEIGKPNIDEAYHCYFKLSDNRFVGCDYTIDYIKNKKISEIYRFFIAGPEGKLYTIWEA